MSQPKESVARSVDDWELCDFVEVEGADPIMVDPPFSNVVKSWGQAAGTSDAFLKVAATILGGSNMCGVDGSAGLEWVFSGDEQYALRIAHELAEKTHTKTVLGVTDKVPAGERFVVGFDCVSQKVVMSPWGRHDKEVRDIADSLFGRPLHVVEAVVLEARQNAGGSLLKISKVHLVVTDMNRKNETAPLVHTSYRVVTCTTDQLTAFEYVFFCL